MTFNQFLKALHKLRNNGWSCVNGDIRCQDGWCPILAVYRAKHPRSILSNSDMRKAGRDLGLKVTDITRIVNAADYVTMDPPARKSILASLSPSKAAPKAS